MGPKRYSVPFLGVSHISNAAARFAFDAWFAHLHSITKGDMLSATIEIKAYRSLKWYWQ